MGPNGVLFGKPRLSGQIFSQPLGVLFGFLESKGRGGRQHKYEYSPFSFISFLHVFWENSLLSFPGHMKLSHKRGAGSESQNLTAIR